MGMPWSTKIARPITLSNGTQLVTLGDAVHMLIDNFAGVEPASIEPTIGLMVRAESSRKAADIEAATNQIELRCGRGGWRAELRASTAG
jgi:hypothetical protein